MSDFVYVCDLRDKDTGLCVDGHPCDHCNPFLSQAEHSQPEKGVPGNATEREE